MVSTDNWRVCDWIRFGLKLRDPTLRKPETSIRAAQGWVWSTPFSPMVEFTSSSIGAITSVSMWFQPARMEVVTVGRQVRL